MGCFRYDARTMRSTVHGRQFISSRGAAGIACALGFAFFLMTGCTDRACLDWPAERGECPSRDDAFKRFGGQSCVGPIKDVLSEAERDGETVCCYEVEKRKGNDRSCASGASTSAGTPIPTTPCTGCAKFLSGESSELCPESVDLFNAFVACVCSGPCTAPCDDGSCATSFDTPECQSCVGDPVNGCGLEFEGCMGD